nr:glycerophosphodiester phosphodiesterase family protein [uncultured Tateyamaria sp.]
MDVCRIAAHRGGALEQIENTLPTFRHAVAIGADEVELDIHRSADGVVVVHHDATLDRMTSGQGAIGDHDHASLQTLRVGASETARIPTLEAVLPVLAASSVTLRLEVKRAPDGAAYPGMLAQAIDRVVAHGLERRFYVTSFHVDDLASLASVLGDAKSLLLMEDQTYRAIGPDGLSRKLDTANTREVALPIGSVDADLLEQMQKRGIVMSAFGCHDEARIRKALQLQLPVFTTDRPSLALALRRQAKTT